MCPAVLDQEMFFRRIERLYTSWKDGKTETGEFFPAIDSICIAIGGDDKAYCKSQSFQIWLLGYEISDMIMLFNKNSIHFLASKKKIEFLRQVEQHKENNSIPSIKLHLRSKVNSDKENFEKLIGALKASREGKTLGIFVKDEFSGPFVDSWNEALKQHSFENVDISSAVASLLSVKDEAELSLVKMASQVSTNVYQKYLRDQVMEIIDSDKKVKHAKLAESVEKAINDEKYAGNKIDTSQLVSCYPPIIQSGGNYNLKFSAESDQKPLHFGVIICFLGARYKMYCSNIIRTLLVNPSDSVQENYNFLVDLQEHLISVLKHDIKLCDVYQIGIDFTREKKPSLVDNLTKNFGFVTGIEFRESSLIIASKTTTRARKSQVFNLCVGLSNLVDEKANSKEKKNYSLFIGDTVIVNEDGPATVLTNSKKRVKNIGIFLKNESDDEEENISEQETQRDQPRMLTRRQRTALSGPSSCEDTSNEEKRKQHQKELMAKLNEDARQRLTGQSSSSAPSEGVRESIVSYTNHDQMPVDPEMKQLKIFVDRKHETVIFPIFGLTVPFHISTIKNISQSVEGDYTYLRINFFYPGATIAKEERSQFANHHPVCAKEVTYRSKNLREPDEALALSSNLNQAFQSIKEVQKKFKTKESEEKQKLDLVEQDSLVVSKQNLIKLKDLFVRPNISNKKVAGTLEAHENGFRYMSIKGDKIDILYNNIKHALFQPCDNEIMVLLHFHLKNAIMFGKKKHLDVQFYTEVGEMSTDLSKHQHMHDRDNMVATQAEKQLRHKLNTAFKSFCDKVETTTRNRVDFDSPLREFAFHGRPSRSMVLLEPTSNCLINLTEWPPFVITLDDIEIVYFERVNVSKSFDVAFVDKDYKKVTKVSAIPTEKLDTIKGWLDLNDIVYIQGKSSLDLSKIIKEIILKDPEEFFQNGGWSQIAADYTNGDSESSDEDGDESFNISDTENESENDDLSEASSDNSSIDEDEPDSNEESGKDWSDLEREVEADDRQQEVNLEDEHLRFENRRHRLSSSDRKKNSGPSVKRVRKK